MDVWSVLDVQFWSILEESEENLWNVLKLKQFWASAKNGRTSGNLFQRPLDLLLFIFHLSSFIFHLSSFFFLLLSSSFFSRFVWECLNNRDDNDMTFQNSKRVVQSSIFPWFLVQVFIEFWSYFGHVLVMFWSCFGHVLVRFWLGFSQTLVKFWSSFGHISVKFWSSVGQILVKLGSCFGQVLFKLRSVFGLVLVNFW